MRLFGDVLPFVGFRVVSRVELVRRGMLHKLGHSPVGKWELFELEWLGRGLTLFGRPLEE